MRSGPPLDGTRFDAIRSVANPVRGQIVPMRFDQSCQRLLIEQRDDDPTGRDLLHRRGEAQLPRRKRFLDTFYDPPSLRRSCVT